MLLMIRDSRMDCWCSWGLSCIVVSLLLVGKRYKGPTMIPALLSRRELIFDVLFGSVCLPPSPPLLLFCPFPRRSAACLSAVCINCIVSLSLSLSIQTQAQFHLLLNQHHGSHTRRKRGPSETSRPARHRPDPPSIPQPELASLAAPQQECQTAAIRVVQEGGFVDGHASQFRGHHAVSRRHVYRWYSNSRGRRSAGSIVQHRAGSSEPVDAGSGEECEGHAPVRTGSDVHEHRVGSLIESGPAETVLRYYRVTGGVYGPEDASAVS